jgi:hypothetical protein
VMALMLGVACLGTALGVWLWLGYVVADTFFIAHPSHYAWFERLIRVRGSLLVSYLLLAALLVGMPLAARALSAVAVSGLRPGGRLRKIVVSILEPLLQGAMVYSWVQVAPILIAPVFTWNNLTPPAAATAPLLDHGWILAIVAVTIAAARLFAGTWAVAQPEIKNRLVQLQRTITTLRPRTRWPIWAAAITRAALMTLVLSGFFAGWLDALVCGVFLILIGIAQADWIGRLRLWTRLVSYAPVIVRLLLGVTIAFVVGRVIFKHRLPGLSYNNYRPLLLCLAAAMTAIALLLPKPAEANQARTARLPPRGAEKLRVSGAAAAND